MTRTLSDVFMKDLTQGVLCPVLDRVRKDDTLMLAIRGGYITIYYRGGSLLKLTELGGNRYQPFFDTQYNGGLALDLPTVIADQAAAQQWVDSFQALKLLMDFFFSAHAKPEREFQQLVARENNNSTISNGSEYFITDIEYADTQVGARFDMLALRWLASQRKSSCSCRPVLMEMKYGDGALGGAAGMVKHLEDIAGFVSGGKYTELLETMSSQFNQLHQLGLLNFNPCAAMAGVELKSITPPEVVFVLANHNPRSSSLRTIIDGEKIEKYGQSSLFDLRFFMSSFAGYGMHADNMLTLDQFRALLKCTPSL